MKYKGRRQSRNVEDRRGQSFSGGGRSGGGMGMGIISLIFSLFRGGKSKFAILAIVGVVAFLWITGTNPLELLTGGGGSQPVQSAPQQTSQQDDELAEFVKVVLADTEAVWNQEFEKRGVNYREPTLVLYTSRVQSACGISGAATGPFYCPGDEKLYIDLSFYQTMKNRLGAGGDFAMAYVVAHEVGHHVQKLIGNTDKVHSMRGRVSQAEYNEASVKLELQADFFAGLWAHHADKMFDMLEQGDIEEAMNAAHAIGDDRLQKQAGKAVRPETFTHGTSAQRQYWFKKGYETGKIEEGDTFAEGAV